jgi:primosomal protein N' (replication factor Y)
VVRPGVARARDDLAALTGLDVVEVGGTRASGDTGQVRAPVLIGTQAVLHRVNSASIVVFLDFDQEIVAARYRAGEQALGLLALASRRVAGRSRLGRVVVRTRLPDHEVITAALHADPGILSAVEASRREMLRLPPTTALALLSGDGSPALGEYLAHSELGLEVGGLAAGRILVRAATPEQLADALASASALAASARVEVSPSQV